jgi:hypothetical protein
MSAPLRPGSRRIPRLIESRFPGRNVYVVVIARPELPEYSGDWTLWFAETQEIPGENAQMRPPYPIRKTDIASETEANSSGAGTTIPLAAMIRRDGSVDAVRPLMLGAPNALALPVADLKKWEFRPATRNGNPIDIDVIVEIPYRLPAVHTDGP